ncbi:MAG: T9SS type A sorting domain-containing protein [Rubricoccaceae bacterium]|nr:T9SS type A sorting domain-containing protein [Rubricoccaceae bacterium]
MNDALASTLAKRLTAYSATAGIALACAPDTDAQVVYHDFDPAVFLQVDSFPDNVDEYLLDLEPDGVPDIRFTLYNYNLQPLRGEFRSFGARGQTTGNDVSFIVSSARAFASRFESGDEIGPTLTSGQRFSAGARFAYYGPYYGSDYPFNRQIGYAGFRFEAGGDTHYGWVRLGASAVVDRARIFDYAYEATPDVPIIAGDMGTPAPSLLLEGSLNQTQVPPDGGTFIFTGTVENTTDEPQEIEVWAVARRLNERERLLDVIRGDVFTVPAGATVPVEASAPVPPSTPAGRAELRFNIGSYPRVFDSEAFIVTKEDGARASEADVSLSATGTHVLSAPRPNPTEGRTTFGLEVANPQHVSVAVHDALGRRVATLHEGALAEGTPHRLVFDGTDLPAGVYAVRVLGEDFTETRVFSLSR